MRQRKTLSIIGRTIAGWPAVLLLLAASAFLSSRILDERLSSARPDGRETGAKWNLVSEVSRRPSLAFGFRNFLGDLVWLKAVQVASPLRMSRGDYDELSFLLNTVIDLDPRFKVPYLLGGVILGDSPDHAREALSLLNQGRKRHPEEWRIPFYMGYIWYFSLGDPVEGGKKLLEAARIPESAPYLPLLAARMLSEGRAPETALAFLAEMINQETDPGRREALQRRNREVIVERDIQLLERAVEEYRNRTGRLPERLMDLVGAGLIRAIPREPHGGSYLVMPDGKIRSDRVDTRMKVFRRR